MSDKEYALLGYHAFLCFRITTEIVNGNQVLSYGQYAIARINTCDIMRVSTTKMLIHHQNK